jgi:SAM-dependent methyltransferase
MAERHYHEQMTFAESYMIPFFQETIPGFVSKSVLEIGCAEGGVLTALRRFGMNAIGVELSEHRVALARALDPGLDVRVGDLTDPALAEQWDAPFDLVVLRDVIEHVQAREIAFANLARLVRPGGFVYITFPPRFSPFAGHQQNARSAFRRIPWLQLWPAWLVRSLGGRLGESQVMIDHVIENGRIGLSLRAFHRHFRRAGFRSVREDLFLVRPIYRQRFGWKPRRFPRIPILGELLTTGCETLLLRLPRSE